MNTSNFPPNGPLGEPVNRGLAIGVDVASSQDRKAEQVNAAVTVKDETRRDPKAALLDRIERDFTYHAPKGDQIDRYALVRETAKKLARVIVENCPVSREMSTALTNLDAAVFNANAAIARNE